MKKSARKLQLSRETLHHLMPALREVAGGVALPTDACTLTCTKTVACTTASLATVCSARVNCG
jgi:hypothetical protein